MLTHFKEKKSIQLRELSSVNFFKLKRKKITFGTAAKPERDFTWV